MKKFLLVPLLIAGFSLSGISEETSPQTPEIQTEQKLVDEVLSDYRNGRYNSFLNSIDTTFREGSKKWEYNSALEQRKKLSDYVHDFDQKKEGVFNTKLHALMEAQDSELIDICVNNPNEKLSREVKDMVFFAPSPEEQESLDYVHGLSYKFKGDGTSPLENKLISIDTEFWLKSLSLGIALSQNKLDKATYEKQYLVLQVEKLKQMRTVCEGDSYDGEKTKAHVLKACDLIPKVHASTITRKHLMALGQGKVAPQNSIEKSMQSIMAKYLEKEQSLVQKHFPESK